MTVDVRQAYRYALANNPELATARQQRHIAAAGLVQARTYPFNPYLSVSPRGVIGTFDEGVLQHYTFAGAVTLELEVFGQKGKRVRVAEAGLSRTELEIAAQEFSVAVRAVRAFNKVIYRKGKLKLLEDNVRIAEQAMQDAKEVWKKKKEKVPAGESVLSQFEVREAKAHFVGASVGIPVPLLNRKKGEILQREAELTRAILEQQQSESQVRQEVKSALARLTEVQELIRVYRKDYLPALETRSRELEKLYAQGGEGVDLQQVLELRRRLLKTRENYLDALYDHGQLEVDLAAAVGDLELAFDP